MEDSDRAGRSEREPDSDSTRDRPKGALAVDSHRAICLADLVSDPTSHRPPQAVVPRLAFEGRITLLAAPEKAGKSTLAAAAAASVTRGADFLSERTKEGIVLLVWLEEHRDELIEKMLRFGADLDRVFLLDSLQNARHPTKELEKEIHALDPALVIIDSLTVYGEQVVNDPWSSQGWKRLFGPLIRVTRSGPATLILHHTRKSDGEYRDSSAIGAAVDQILTMSQDSSDPDGRRIRSRGRWSIGDYAIRLDADSDEYQLTEGDGALTCQILTHLRDNPRSSSRSLREAVRGRNESIDEEVRNLLASGVITDEGSSAARAYSLTDPARQLLKEGVPCARISISIRGTLKNERKTVPQEQTDRMGTGHGELDSDERDEENTRAGTGT